MEKKAPDTTKLVIITAIIAFIMTAGFIYIGTIFFKKTGNPKTENTQAK